MQGINISTIWKTHENKSLFRLWKRRQRNTRICKNCSAVPLLGYHSNISPDIKFPAMTCIRQWIVMDTNLYIYTQKSRIMIPQNDRLCGLLVTVPGYRSRGPGSISGTTRFFVRSSGSGTGSTQPCEDNWGATWKDSSGSGLENRN
jgi:hypothetical protein